MRFFVFVLFLTSLGCQIITSYKFVFDRKILWKEFEAHNHTKNLIDVAKYRQDLREHVKQLLLAVPEDVKQQIAANADKVLAQKWQVLEVSQFLEYVKTGNRVNFEGSQTLRRNRLSQLVVAELVTNKGKYLDAIANGLWLILEESTWMLPAHVGLQKAGPGLPDPKEPVIDLRVGDTLSLVSWTRFLLFDQLATYAPHQMMVKRIDFEINKRMVQPFLTHDNWAWMGFKSMPVNNWNPWINTNILTTVILTIDDPTIRQQVISKMIRSADKFPDSYPDDGGCDEGPGYWGAAGGRLIELIDLLTSVSDGRLSWAGNQLIRNMGDYIYKAHIDKDRFVNFADANARLIADPIKLLRYGQLFNETRMNEFAAYMNKLLDKGSRWMLDYFKDLIELLPSTNPLVQTINSVETFIYELLMYDKLIKYQPKAPQVQVSWLKDRQVTFLRSEAGSAAGMFLAAKGGNNDESHNHNDVGSFIIYLNGQPALIDIGAGTYTNETFGPNRYKIWYMQSQWHNLVTINGVMQQAGSKFKARNVTFNSGKVNMFSLDMADAYPANASVRSWVRTFAFDSQKSQMKLTDEYELTEWKQPWVVHLITTMKVNNMGGQLHLTGNNQHLVMDYDSQVFDNIVTVDTKRVDDPVIEKFWGKSILRINMTARNDGRLKGRFDLTFRMV